MQVTVSAGDKGDNCSWELKPDLLTSATKSDRAVTKNGLSEFYAFCPPGDVLYFGAVFLEGLSLNFSRALCLGWGSEMGLPPRKRPNA